MPAREPKIVIPKWMWGLGVLIVPWAVHQSIELALVRGAQGQILTRLDRLEEKAWQLNGKGTGTRTAAFSAPSPVDSSKPSPFPDARLHDAAASIEGTSAPLCEGP